MAGIGNYNITITINLQAAKELQEAINNINSNIKSTEEKTGKISKNIEKSHKSVKPFLRDWERLTIVMNQLLELMRKMQFFIELLRKPLAEAGLFEQFRTTLKNLIGDTETANDRFREMLIFAAKTPFTVPGVVEAGNRLQALGRYSLNTIRMLGDLAAASGKDVSQAIEAYTNLVVGRTGMAVKQFRAMLISNADWTREIGKQVLKNSGDVTASVAEMLEALPKIIAKKGFTGLMEQQSKTYLGIMSNFEDAVQRLLAAIGDEFIEKAKKVMNEIIDFIDKIIDKLPSITKYFESLRHILRIIISLGLIKFALKLADVFTLLMMRGFGLNTVFNTLKISLLAIKNSLTGVKTMADKTVVSLTAFERLKLGIKGLAVFAPTAILSAGIVEALLESVKAYRLASNKITTEEEIKSKEILIRTNKERINSLNAEAEKLLTKEDILNKLIALEKKYANQIDNSKDTTEKARWKIEEYRATLASARNVLYDYIDATGEFTLVTGTSKQAISKLKSELISGQHQFREINNEIIKTNENLRALKKILEELKIKKIMEEFSKEMIKKVEEATEGITDPISAFGQNIGYLLQSIISGVDVNRGTSVLIRLFKNTQNEASKFMERIAELSKDVMKGQIQDVEEFRQRYLDIMTELSSKSQKIQQEIKDALYKEFGIHKDDKRLKNATEKVYNELLSLANDYFNSLNELVKNRSEIYSESFVKVLEQSFKGYLNTFRKKGLEEIKIIEEQIKALQKLSDEASKQSVKDINIKLPKYQVEQLASQFNDDETRQEIEDQINKDAKDLEEIEVKIPIKIKTSDDLNAFKQYIANLITTLDTTLESLKDNSEEAKKKALNAAKEVLNLYKIKYEKIINEFKESLSLKNIDDVIDDNEKFFSDYFVIYAKAASELEKLNKDFERETKKFQHILQYEQQNTDFINDYLNTSLKLKTYQVNLTSELAKSMENVTFEYFKSIETIKDAGIKVNEILSNPLFLKEGIEENIETLTQIYEILKEGYKSILNNKDIKINRQVIAEFFARFSKVINEEKLRFYQYKKVEINLNNLIKVLPPENIDINTFRKWLDDNVKTFVIEAKNIGREAIKGNINFQFVPEINEEEIMQTIKYNIEGLNKLIQTNLEDSQIKIDIATKFIESEDKLTPDLTANKLKAEYLKQQLDYYTKIYSILNNSITVQEEELTKKKEQGINVSEEENKLLLERKSKLEEILKVIKDIVKNIAEINIEIKVQEEDEVINTLNRVYEVANVIYDGLNKIGSLYYENMMNKAKQEANNYLKLQNEKIEAEEKLAMNRARTALQQEKIREAMEKRKQAAQEKARKIELEARRKQFEFEKKMAMAQALINIAVAVTKVFSTTGPLGLIIAPAIEALLTSVYLAMIASQKFPEYKKGGYTGDKKEDEPAGIVHGKEYVINAESTKKYRPILDAINNDDFNNFIKSTKNSTKEIFNKIFIDNIPLKNEPTLIENIKYKPIYIDNTNKELLNNIKNLNNNLVNYLENPVPAVAYLNDNEAERIARKGLAKIKRKVI